MKQPNFMAIAFEEAKRAGERGEVPVGAVVVYNNAIVSQAGNETRLRNDPTAHAEIVAIRKACEAFNQERLSDFDLYVTLEPCAMCAGAISFARIRRLYYGPDDPKGGGVEHGGRFFAQPTCHHAPDVYSGIDATRSAELLRSFFSVKRSEPRTD